VAFLFAIFIAAEACGQMLIVSRVPVALNPASNVAVNSKLNRIYVSGGNAARQDVYVIDGHNLKARRVGIGSNVSVDAATNHYWAAMFTSSRAIVRMGDNQEDYRVSTSEGCTVSTAFDNRARRVWLGNQCSETGDALYVFDGDNYAQIAGPISTGGELSDPVVSSATGRLYFAAGGVSKRVNTETFQVTRNAFGIVKASDPVTGKLFAVNGQRLEIINAIHDPEVVSVSVELGYAPAGLAVNFALGHIYLSNPTLGNIEVRTNATGELVTAFSLGKGVVPVSLAVDPKRGRLYVAATVGGQGELVVLEDGQSHAGSEEDQ